MRISDWSSDVCASDLVAPLLLLCGAWWMLFATMTFYDLMMASCELLAWIGMALGLHHGGRWTGILITGIAIGLGVLTKGPVILVYALPPALFAPLWASAERRPGWLGWYAGVDRKSTRLNSSH